MSRLTQQNQSCGPLLGMEELAMLIAQLQELLQLYGSPPPPSHFPFLHFHHHHRNLLSHVHMVMVHI
ncbi:hypothetical protein V6N12_020781 [Hibiscus sabdariffa]|uniref:Uncharacterized protein n=1 Tax=Hibiscus sabdariffa TaxID=183260 RepID=A0ABR2CZ29_9ROSI